MLWEHPIIFQFHHELLFAKRLVKIIPQVVYMAHEYCKALGRQLESELKSVVAKLFLLQRTCINPANVKLLPMTIREYLQRMNRFGGGDNNDG